MSDLPEDQLFILPDIPKDWAQKQIRTVEEMVEPPEWLIKKANKYFI